MLFAGSIGAFSGMLSAFFLWSLDRVTWLRNDHPWLIFFLPLAGFLIAWLYDQYGRGLESGNNLIIDEVFEPKTSIQFRLAPLVLFGTVVTHLFGGSAGREGTAVQMGGATADVLGRLTKRSMSFDRRQSLICGIAAGFASVFGTPLAACVFAFELFAFRHLRVSSVIVCIVAAFIAHFVSLKLGATHADYRSFLTSMPGLAFGFDELLAILAAGLAFGLIARSFAMSTHAAAKIFMRIRYAPLRTAVGGMLVAMLVLVFDLDRYQGLGLSVITDALHGSAHQTDFIWKIILTAFTLGSGFKGGEVTPLFFIGATAGQTLAPWLSMLPSLMAMVGFVAVFAGAANVPLACIVMGGEIFGWEATPYFALACLASYLVSGRHGIYRAQRPELFRFKVV